MRQSNTTIHPFYMMKSIIINLLLLTVVFTQNTNKTVLTIEKKLQDDMLANKLFDERKFQLAIIEFERLKLSVDDINKFKVYQQKIAESYLKRGERIEAINEYRKLTNIDSAHFISTFKIANIYQDLYYFYESNQFLDKVNKNFKGSQLDTLEFLKAINYFALNKPDSALSMFQNNTLIQESSKAVSIINNYNNMNKKNPKTATYLNTIFPGAGYLYLDLIQTAVATFFVEALFGYATIASANNGYTFGSIFGGILFSGFYIGSIYGASQQAVKKRNLLLNDTVFALKIILMGL